MTLMKRLDSQNAKGRGPLLAAVNHRKFDTVVLDVRWPDKKPQNEVHGLGEIRPGWVGKSLVVTAEINGPKTLKVLEQYLINGLPNALLWLISHRYQTAR
jgi:hypothetical protein